MSEKICKSFGNYIKEKRLQLGLSQQEVADRMGIHQVAYGRYELGSREANLSTIKALEKALEFNVQEFFDRYED